MRARNTRVYDAQSDICVDYLSRQQFHKLSLQKFELVEPCKLAHAKALKSLITGIDGFVGGHLAAHLMSRDGSEVFGTTWMPSSRYQDLKNLGVTLTQIDLKDPDAVRTLITNVEPDQIYHLAAQSFVPASFDNPWETLENNIRGELNLLHSMAESKLAARILVVGSAEEYGLVRQEELPIDEDQPLRPANPYSVSKVAQDMLAHQYWAAFGVSAIRVRPFNHTGPGQSDQFAAPSFASQIAAIERGDQPKVIKVGNLAGRRDITDVRDVVRAYELVMSSGAPGEVYNIGQDRSVSIDSVLHSLLELSSTNIKVQVDPARFRPIDIPEIVCDSSKIRAATGWKPEIPLRTTLMDILEYWRKRLSANTL